MSKEIRVTLNDSEIKLGNTLGSQRYATSRKMGLIPGCSMADDIFGSLAEIATAKAIRHYFNGNLNSFKGADIGDKLQVRGTRYKTGRLIIKDNDNPNHRYLLVRSDDSKTFTLVGWLPGKIAKKLAKQEVHGGKVINFVPTDKLYPPDLLIEKMYFTVVVKNFAVKEDVG